MVTPPRRPSLVLGTAQWGMPYGIANRSGRPSEEEIRQILHLAADRGVASLDTARAYGDSEEIIGRIAGRAWEVTTKVPAMGGACSSEAAERTTKASLAASRRALRRDVLDVVLLHDAADRLASNGAAWARMCDEQRGGGIKTIGVSTSSVAEAEAAIEEEAVGAVQVAASVVDRRLVDNGFFERAADRDVRVFARSVFLQGALLVPASDLPSHLAPLSPAVQALAAVARDAGVPVGHLCLAYVRDRLRVEAVVGTESLEQVRANLTWWAAEIPPDVLDAAVAAAENLPEGVLDPWRWPSSPPARGTVSGPNDERTSR